MLLVIIHFIWRPDRFNWCKRSPVHALQCIDMSFPKVFLLSRLGLLFFTLSRTKTETMIANSNMHLPASMPFSILPQRNVSVWTRTLCQSQPVCSQWRQKSNDVGSVFGLPCVICVFGPCECKPYLFPPWNNLLFFSSPFFLFLSPPRRCLRATLTYWCWFSIMLKNIRFINIHSTCIQAQKARQIPKGQSLLPACRPCSSHYNGHQTDYISN